MSKKQRILLSGASSEIGKAVIRHYLAEGSEVIALTRDAARLQESLRTSGISAEGVTIIAVDLTGLRETRAALDAAMASTDGRLTTVINAVGRFVAGAMGDCTQDDFETAYQLNLQAVFHTCRAALPYLQKNRRGSIVNVSSILGYSNIDGVLCAAYGAAKAGLIQYTRMLAVELAPQNIRVNCVCPGVLNPLAEKMDPSNLEQMKTFRRLLEQQPIKQFGNPQQIADAIIYLSGPQSAWTTGSILTVDGGMAVA